MKCIDVYKQYFAADCVYNGVKRRGVSVALTSTSESGTIKYEVTVSFFPHADESDFSISYDACASTVIYEGAGRRSKKREAALFEDLRSIADETAAFLDGKIYWDKPLIEARFG
jgi:hypothetical protein